MKPGVIDPTVGKESNLYREEIRNTIVKNGPKNPIKGVSLPAGFPAAFDSGQVQRSAVRFPKYSSDVVVQDHRTSNEVIAESGWSSREGNYLKSLSRKGLRP